MKLCGWCGVRESTNTEHTATCPANPKNYGQGPKRTRCRWCATPLHKVSGFLVCPTCDKSREWGPGGVA